MATDSERKVVLRGVPSVWYLVWIQEGWSSVRLGFVVAAVVVGFPL